MSRNGGMTFTFESARTGEIIKKRGLEEGGIVQQYVDSEVMRYMEPYMPKLNGTMIDSMVIATNIGSGEVVVNTDYAKKVSKKARYNEKEPLRGAHFFERMKADHNDDILNGAAIISGAKPSK